MVLGTVIVMSPTAAEQRALAAALAVEERGLEARAPMRTRPSAMKNATQSEIEEALTCQCGCGLTVHSCNHVQCPSGIPLKEEIAGQLAAGKTGAEVLTYFSTKYGEKILSSPTTTGFNLVAWVTPFAAVFVRRGGRRRSCRAAGVARSPSHRRRPRAVRTTMPRARGSNAELDRFDA